MPSLNTKLATAPNVTSNYVLRATSSTTIGNSTIQDDGTNVAIGTTPGTYKLNVSGTLNATGAATFSSSVTAAQSKFWDGTQGLLIGAYSAASGFGAIYPSTVTPSSTNHALAASSGATVLNTGSIGIIDLEINAVSALYISNSRNVGIGTSSTGFNTAGLPLVVGSGSGNTGLTIFSGASSSGSIHFADAETTGAGSYAGFINYTHSTNSMQFGTTGATPAERMRITNDGLIVGGTDIAYTSTNRGNITLNGSSNNILGFANGTTSKGYLYHTGTDMVLQQDASGLLYAVNGSGGVYLAKNATSWTANSDERLKDINNKIENAVDKIKTLRAVNFSWKADESKREVLGLIAQDVEKVFPQVVDKNKFTSKADEEQTDITEYLGVRYQDLVPVLVAAIQELKAEIDELKNK